MSLKYFKKDEFPEDIKYANPELLTKLDMLREFINKPIYPSPAPGALARFSGSTTSRHYAVNRLSDACDIFIDCNTFDAFLLILQSKLFNRVGVYFDTYFHNKPHTMFHVDLKDQQLIWYRDAGKYFYQFSNDFNILQRMAGRTELE
jgi:hypothetical protein